MTYFSSSNSWMLFAGNPVVWDTNSFRILIRDALSQRGRCYEIMINCKIMDGSRTHLMI